MDGCIMRDIRHVLTVIRRVLVGHVPMMAVVMMIRMLVRIDHIICGNLHPSNNQLDYEAQHRQKENDNRDSQDLC